MDAPTVSTDSLTRRSEKSTIVATRCGPTAGPTPPQATKLTKFGSNVSFILTVISLALSVFCVAFSDAVTITAGDAIVRDLDKLYIGQWYSLGYLLPLCASLLLSGKLYERYSPKWILVGGLALFLIGSLIIALGRSLAVFLTGRIIAGTGAAITLSGSFIIVSLLTPPAKNPLLQSVVGAAFGLGYMLGLLIGGAITNSAVWPASPTAWRWCFYIILPIIAVSIILKLCSLNIEPPQFKKLPLGQLLWSFDPIGIALFIASIICLNLALQTAGIVTEVGLQFMWGGRRTNLLFILFAVFWIGFCVDQHFMGANAGIPTRIGFQRTFLATSWFIFCIFGAFINNVYNMSLYLDTIAVMSPRSIGLRLVPLGAATVITILATGYLSTKSGHYVPFFLASTILCSIGCALLTTWEAEWAKAAWWGYPIIQGIGTGLALQLPVVAIQATLPDEDLIVGIAAILTMQFLGAVILVGVSHSVFVNVFIEQLVQSAIVEAIQGVFCVSLTFACLSVIGVIGMEWKKKVKDHDKKAENQTVVV